MGLKEHVGPDSQESAILLVKLLGADAVTVNVTEVVPTRITFEGLGVIKEKIGAPVPERVTAWEVVDALSLMLTLPVRDPVAVGVNVARMVQLALAASDDGQLLV